MRSDCEVTLVGCQKLAAYAEAELAGATVSDAEISAEIAPCFRDDGGRTDTIVLACTHYPLLIERLAATRALAGHFIDPAPAIARRVVDLLGPRPAAGRARRGPFSRRAVRRRRCWLASAFASAELAQQRPDA